MKEDEYVKGTCMQMCPEQEIKDREVSRLLHVLEMEELPGYFGRPKADRKAMVKCYQRSAAGTVANRSKAVRPPDILHTTIHYLLARIVSDERVPFPEVYEFVTDRLRAVRQDMIVQQLTPNESIPLLEPMVRFHAYSAYRLGDVSSHSFDPVLNHKFLFECLKWVLTLYDCCAYISEERLEMEALYLLLNLGDEEALLRSLELPSNIRYGLVTQAEGISLSWCLGNYYNVCRQILFLPPILAALMVATQLPHVRRFALNVMSIAYSSKNLRCPLSHLCEVLKYNSPEEAGSDGTNYGLDVDENSICFLKSRFQCKEKEVIFRRINHVDNQLTSVPLPELLYTRLK